ncbi:Trafficking protein particle complex subunit 13, partial [Grifola frondosa]
MDGTGQLLSLKVMRVSRPSLASAWEPFYSSSPSFSAHSTASVMSLQGKTPLPNHPKTLRDLTHITEVLMLPAAFGAIQLGETFSSCLSVNNDATVDVEAVVMRVEMQTANTKTVLAEFGGVDHRLPAGESLERVVSHEIKELGQHVLACTVSYRLPPGIRAIPSPATDTNDPAIQTFRKFYKFAVTNPLSVKTKVHLPRAPTALLSRTDREKVFLEVHIQNLTQDAMWLERMHFECTEGWAVQDANLIEETGTGEKEYLFKGPTALMQPQDLRQYIYVMSPKILTLLPTTYPPGSIISLGRLDISWRSSFGEPGRLITSPLSRRIPLIQAPTQPQTPTQPTFKQPVSAIPLHLQRSNTVGGVTPPRPRSPQLNQRPMSPPANPASPIPYRPGSPFRSRTATTAPSARTQSPAPAASPNPPPRTEDVEVDLVVRHIPRESISAEKPFTIAFSITVNAPVPVTRPAGQRKQRVLTLVLQHLQPLRTQLISASTEGAQVGAQREPFSPRLPSSSGFSTPSPYGTPYRGDFQDTLAQRLLVASPRRANADVDSDAGTDTDRGADTPAAGARVGGSAISLPPPVLQPRLGEGVQSGPLNDVLFLGTSALFLPQFKLTAPAAAMVGSERGLTHDRNLSADSEADSEAEDISGSAPLKVAASQDFELSYLPMKGGFLTVGGLRAVLVEDRLIDANESVDGPGGEDGSGARPYATEIRTLKEWDVVGEIWVKS